MNYTARIQHSEETFRQLAKVQYNAYCQGTKLILIAIALVCLYLGFLRGNGSVASFLLMFVGCWTATSIQAPAKRNADKLIRLADGHFPCTNYRFSADAVQITSDDSSTTLAYNQLFSILEDPKYFYLFVSPLSGYMVPRDSLSPADPAAFRALLETGSGLKTERPGGLLSLNARAMRLRNQNRKARNRR